MARHQTLILILGACFVLAGCVSQVRKNLREGHVERMEQECDGLPQQFKNVAVKLIDPSLRHQVHVRENKPHRSDVGNLEVNVELVNCTASQLVVEARTTFFTTNEQPAEPVTIWQEVVMERLSLGGYHAASVSGGRARGYYIELRGQQSSDSAGPRSVSSPHSSRGQRY